MGEEQEEAVLRITSRYVAEVRAGKQPRVGDYLAQYPQYRDAIVDFVLYYHAIETSGVEDADPVPLSEVSRTALDSVLRTLPPPHIVKPLTSLLVARSGRFTPSQLAVKLDVSVDIVSLLEQRTLNPATIPYELYTRLAILLHQPVGAIQAYLTSSAHTPRNRSGEHRYLRVAERSSLYPEQGEQGQSFRRVLETSALLSAEQKSRWHAILSHEGL